MPAPIDLTGKRTPDYFVLGLDDRKSQTTRRRYWRVQCLHCPREDSVQTCYLNGTSRYSWSCGCRNEMRGRKGLPNGNELRAAHKKKEVVTIDGDRYFAPRRAIRELGGSVSHDRLKRWANLDPRGVKKGCFWLDGHALRFRQESVFGQTRNYYLAADIERIRVAMTLPPIPRYPGLTHVLDAVREVGVDTRDFYRLAAKQVPPVRAIKRWGWRTCLGTVAPVKRNYFRTADVEALKAVRAARDGGWMLLTEAAAELGISRETVRAYGYEGRLDVRPKGVPVPHKAGRYRAYTSTYPARRAYSRESVERLKRELWSRSAAPTDDARLRASEIASRLGYPPHPSHQKSSLNLVLKYWRERGDVPAEYVRESLAVRRGPSRVWLYDFDRARELLAGRDVRTLARELKKSGSITTPAVGDRRAGPAKAVEPTDNGKAAQAKRSKAKRPPGVPLIKRRLAIYNVVAKADEPLQAQMIANHSNDGINNPHFRSILSWMKNEGELVRLPGQDGYSAGHRPG